jgi:hypothetical protein
MRDAIFATILGRFAGNDHQVPDGGTRIMSVAPVVVRRGDLELSHHRDCTFPESEVGDSFLIQGHAAVATAVTLSLGRLTGFINADASEPTRFFCVQDAWPLCLL